MRSRILIRTGRSFHPEEEEFDEISNSDALDLFDEDLKKVQQRAVKTTFMRPPIPAPRGGHRYKRDAHSESENFISPFEHLIRYPDSRLSFKKRAVNPMHLKMMRIG